MKLRQAGSRLDEALDVELAEEWDNPGWTVGELDRDLQGILVCVDPSREALARAVDRDLNLVLSHHPLLIDPVDSVLDDSPDGRIIIQAVKEEIAFYAAHTNVDSMNGGLNDEFVKLFDLRQPVPIDPHPADETVGLGRVGSLTEPQPLGTLEERLEENLDLTKLESIGPEAEPIERVAVCTGSGGSFINHPRVQNADLYVTGDVDHHEALDAKQSGLCLINLDHYEMEAVFLPVAEQICRNMFADDIPLETFRRENPFRRSTPA